MALPINIESLLHGKAVEWERLEFKAGWDPLAVMHTICAFANDFHNLGGGYIIVGVAEKQGQPRLPPVGLKLGQIDAIQKEILNLGHNAIQPFYHPVVVPAEINGRHILVIWVLGGQTRPYKARLTFAKDGKEYAYFIRKGSNTVRAKGADETELLSLAATVPFDDRINQRAKVKDLSRELMQNYLRQVGSSLAKPARTLPLVKLGRQMGVIGGAEEAPFPLNVGLMMFNPQPHRFFPVMQIDVVWFPKDGPGGNKFTEKIFQGPLPRMTHDALDYIKRNFISETVIKHHGRAESTRVENFPYDAIEEAVVNAVYHRGYDVREPVEVRIAADELVVLSYPGPDRSVRLDQPRAGGAPPRPSRNGRLGEFRKELEFTEGRSTGIPKIIRAMRENGSPPAEFEFDDDHSYFMVRLPVHRAALEVAESVTGKVTVQSIRPVGTKLALSRHQVGILRNCEVESPIGDLMNIAERADRTKFRNQVLSPLLADGLLEMTIPDKPRSSKQAYRITQKGRKLLASLRAVKG